MTSNNKTTIDGIDVSECEFFTPTEVTVLGGGFETQIYCGQVNEFSDDAFTQNAPNLHCERCPNCYFKQLARAKEEIEKLKSELSETIGTIDNIRRSKEHWQKVSMTDSQDVERLSEELQAKEQECEELKEKINKYSKINEQDTRDFVKYGQALNSIEELVSGNYETLDPLAKQEILEIIKQAKDGE